MEYGEYTDEILNELEKRTAERDDLVRANAELAEKLRSVTSAMVSAAATAEAALERLQRAQAVIDAAYALCEKPVHLSVQHRGRLEHAVNKHRAGAPS